jgi:hypothetical protein
VRGFEDILELAGRAEAEEIILVFLGGTEGALTIHTRLLGSPKTLFLPALFSGDGNAADGN